MIGAPHDLLWVTQPERGKAETSTQMSYFLIPGSFHHCLGPLPPRLIVRSTSYVPATILSVT